MFSFLALVAACSLLSLGSVASANAPTFPQSLPLDAGPEGVVIDNVGNLYATVGLADRVEVRKFSPTGAQELLATLPGTSAAGMAVSPNGRTVYAAVGFVGVFCDQPGR